MAPTANNSSVYALHTQQCRAVTATTSRPPLHGKQTTCLRHFHEPLYALHSIHDTGKITVHNSSSTLEPTPTGGPYEAGEVTIFCAILALGATEHENQAKSETLQQKDDVHTRWWVRHRPKNLHRTCSLLRRRLCLRVVVQLVLGLPLLLQLLFGGAERGKGRTRDEYKTLRTNAPTAWVEGQKERKDREKRWERG